MKQENWVHTGIGIVLFLLIGLGIGYFSGKSKEDGYWKKKGFKTDTITQKVFVADTGGKNTQIIPPKIVYKYLEQNIPSNNYQPLVIHDTIKLKDSTTGKTINLYPCFYDTYIGTPKIIGARFTKNGISLDIWDTTCHTNTQVYPIDLDKYDYFWTGTDIRIGKEHFNTIPKIGGFSKMFSTSCNLYLTDEIFTQTPNIAIDYSLNFKSFGIYTLGSIGYTIQNQDISTRLNIGLRIKIK